MIDKFKIITCFYDLNPKGDVDQVAHSINMILSGTEKTNMGEDVTFELICNKYKEYCDWWDSQYEGRDAQYISKNEKKKEPQDFLKEELYKQRFEIQKTGRDVYLFGSLKSNALKDLHKRFLDGIRKR